MGQGARREEDDLLSTPAKLGKAQSRSAGAGGWALAGLGDGQGRGGWMGPRPGGVNPRETLALASTLSRKRANLSMA